MHIKPVTLKRFFIHVGAALFIAQGASVQAGALADGSWQPSGCGAAPVAPTLDLRSPEAFNKGVDAVNAYRQAIRPYLDCLIKEANVDVSTISQAAQAAQLAVKAANDKISADVRAAEEKFK